MEFIEQLKHKLKQNNLTDSTIDLYIKNLIRIHNGENFKNLNFLLDDKKILELLEVYKKNTKRSYLISIVSCLNVIKDTNKKFKKTYDKYYSHMKSLSDEIKKEPTDELNETQKKGYINYDELMKEYDKLSDEITDEIAPKDKLNKTEYNKLLVYVVLSLYLLSDGPRRSKDFQEMWILFDGYDEEKHNDKDKNYLDVKHKLFIFNNYKTKKTYGQQIIVCSNQLFKVLLIYFGFHPLLKIKNTNDDIPLLVSYNGTKLNKSNGITQILNKFRDNLGSSMLRHIFITHKFDKVEKEKEEVANNMAHSVQTQKNYIKHE